MIKLNEAQLRKVVAESVRKVLKEFDEVPLSDEEYAAKVNDGTKRAKMLVNDFQRKCVNFLPYAMVNQVDVYSAVEDMVTQWAKDAVQSIYGDLRKDI